MTESTPHFRANRILSYWTPYNPDHLLDYLDEIRPQVLQIGHFGPLFFSMACTDHADYFGVPAAGIDEGIAWWKAFIAQVRQRGIRVVGLFSLCFHYGDHLNRSGWFKFWHDLWDEDMLGPKPCEDPFDLLQIDEEGNYRFQARGGELGNEYRACLNNPYWIETLKRMICHAVHEIGLDGFNTVYNYVMGCCCAYCQAALRQYFKDRYTPSALKRQFGIDHIDRHAFPRIPFHYDANKDGLFELECVKFTHRTLKRAYDRLFIEYGRRLKPDLIAATWFHQYGYDTFGQLGNDERSALPSDLWGKDEDYFWYCLGRQEHTQLGQGHTADVILESRYLRAAAQGRPFIPNRYDHRRLPLYISESVASGGAAIGWHWDTSKKYSAGEMRPYLDTLGRYFRFIERHEACYHPAVSYADTALVFSRASVQNGYPLFARSLRRLGRRLADGHILFDIAIDDQLGDLRDTRYRTIICPDTRYAGEPLLDRLREFVQGGGQAILTGSAFQYDERGRQRKPDTLSDLTPRKPGQTICSVAYGSGRAIYIPQVPHDEQPVGEPSRPVPPLPDQDTFGRTFLGHVRSHSALLTTDAPWTIVFQAYIQDERRRLILHVVNYDNAETSDAYAPIPTPSVGVRLRVPAEWRMKRVTVALPEQAGEIGLDFIQNAEDVLFRLPPVRVYGVVMVEEG